MKTRVTNFLSAIFDEVLTEATDKTSYTAKKGDIVDVIRGAMTGECGEITYIIPGGSMADVKTDTGKIARIAVKHLSKKQKEKKK